MAGTTLDKDDLRLSAITCGSLLGYRPDASLPAGGPALGPKAASEIYAELARFDFTTFSLVPGGAQYADSKGLSILTLTGAGWQFVDNLEASAFQISKEKMSLAPDLLLKRLPDPLVVNQTCDLSGVWDLRGEQDAAKYVQKRFLTGDAISVASSLAEMTLNGGALRLNLSRPSQTKPPPNLGQPLSTEEEYDVRIEPLLRDRTKLYVQVIGRYGVPVETAAKAEKRVEYVKELLLGPLADSIAL